MFKTLTSLENKMRTILKKICQNRITQINITEENTAFALHECLTNNYLENISEWQDANGNYHFELLGKVQVNSNGLKFIRDTSFFLRFLHYTFTFLKGIWGVIIGVAGTLLAQYLLQNLDIFQK